jgi:transcriptional regulator with GAF, ATPase, and Fis domain/tetratricopeptide (TPR) repeat protein
MAESGHDESQARHRPSVPPPAAPNSARIRAAEPLAVDEPRKSDKAEPRAMPPLVALADALAGGRNVVLVANGATAAARAALASHGERLLRLRVGAIDGAVGADLDEVAVVRRIGVRRLDDGEVVEAIALALSVSFEGLRVGHVAERLAERLRRGQRSLVLEAFEPASAATGWAASVLRELVAALANDAGRAPLAPHAPRLLLVTPPGCAVADSLGLAPIVVQSRLAPTETAAWVDAVGRTFARGLAPESSSLDALDGFLRAPSLGEALAGLALAPTSKRSLRSEGSASAALPDDDASPWGLLRRAARALDEGAFDGADQLAARAERLADDPDARRDVGRRWSELLERLSPELALPLMRAATSRALNGADADEAVRWAKLSVRAGELSRASDDAIAGLMELLGRALATKGDVVMSRAVLERARERALAGGSAQARLCSIGVETAEAAYLAGDLASSESEARRALAATDAPFEVRLRARNVLGKLLLARGHFDKADAHFAADAADAARAGEGLAELRAQLNRAIALLWAERLDEAEGLFEQVLEGGRALDLPQAQALAHENLAVIASMRRDYGRALERYRAAIAGLRPLGQAAMLAGAAHNLGYLYLRLGDVAQAASMVRFAATLMRRGLAAPVVAEGDDLRARIAARQGRGEEALAALSRAREVLRAAGDLARVAECDRFEARLALEDGDVRGARLALERARPHDESPRAKADWAIVDAEHRRANGEDAQAVLVVAREALALCRATTDEDLMIEAHLLIAELARLLGDRELVARHVEAAIGVRDGMLRSIPEGFHGAFHARPDLVRLAKLERFLESEPISPMPPALTSQSAGARVRPSATTSEPRTIVGTDPSIRSLMAALRRVAPSDATVLIRGESGTGKELVAEALHFASERAAGPLVKVNCAALVESLLISELFGHEKGAFTGAVARRRGRFELADGGTLFLDEIGDISPRTQVALLRVLQERTFERVGGTTPIRVDVRIVCATHRDLATMVQRGEFREDLFYRLRGVQLEVPPLRARMSDLPELCDHVLRRIAEEHHQAPKRTSVDALELLALHKWPGNIRELENVLRAVALLTDGPLVTAADLVEHVDVMRALEAQAATLRASIPPPSVSGPISGFSGAASEEPLEDEDGRPLPASEASATAVAYGQIRAGSVSLFEMKRMIERDCIARALSETRGNITRAAALLGMKRPRLSQLVKHYGLSALFSEGS